MYGILIKLCPLKYPLTQHHKRKTGNISTRFVVTVAGVDPYQAARGFRIIEE